MSFVKIVKWPDGREVPITHEALVQMIEIGKAILAKRPWTPISDRDGVPHPQRMAYESVADVVGYGGAAGGGKTDLACGLALTKHRKILMLRRVGTELLGIEDRLEELIGNKDGYNGQKKVWKRVRPDGVKQQMEFASLPNLGDERGFQGRPHDLIVYDEAANFLEAQVRFLLGWLRSTIKGQPKKALLAFNPPTSAEGRWIIEFFGAWLSPTHPNPAAYGELRWYGAINGKDVEVADGKPFIIVDDKPCYEFDPRDYRGTKQSEVVTPLSRTFIPSKVTDNPHLMGTGYMSMLQALPEPLRSQMLNGDFMAGVTDDKWQVIPTAWVDAAMARWTALNPRPLMDSLGVDVARGGGDETVIMSRHGLWFDVPKAYPGKETPDGNSVTALTLTARRDEAVIHIDVIGVGSSPYDQMRNMKGLQIRGMHAAEKSGATDQSGRLTFLNQRSEWWWKMREALDPDNGRGFILPPHPRLKADLCAPTWKLSGRTIQVEGKEDIEKRIGRSPDYGTAAVLALIDTPKQSLLPGARSQGMRGEYDPYAQR